MASAFSSGRCVTGIEGLDRILGGGLPAPSVTLVTGHSGTGKTSLALEFLFRGAELGEKGLLVSTIESPERLLAKAIPFDFLDRNGSQDLAEIKKMELTEVLEGAGLMERVFDEKAVQHLCGNIEGVLREEGIRRFVIDSLTPIHLEISSQKLVYHFLKRLGQIMYENECTALLISDNGPYGELERIMADGVLVLDTFERRGDMLRTMQVVKMKGTAHSRGKYVFDLTPEGILMTPLLKGGWH